MTGSHEARGSIPLSSTTNACHNGVHLNRVPFFLAFPMHAATADLAHQCFNCTTVAPHPPVSGGASPNFATNAIPDNNLRTLAF